MPHRAGETLVLETGKRLNQKDAEPSMTDAVSEIAAQHGTSVAPPQRRSLFSNQGNRPLRVLGFVVAFASVLMSLISFLILSGTTYIEPSPAIWTAIWIVTGILVLLVLALVVTEA